MSFMFCDCFSLKSLPDISKWNTKNVTSMSSMFNGCKSLKSLPDLSKWELNKNLRKKDMFQNLDKIVVPEKFKD